MVKHNTETEEIKAGERQAGRCCKVGVPRANDLHGKSGGLARRALGQAGGDSEGQSIDDAVPGPGRRSGHGVRVCGCNEKTNRSEEMRNVLDDLFDLLFNLPDRVRRQP